LASSGILDLTHDGLIRRGRYVVTGSIGQLASSEFRLEEIGQVFSISFAVKATAHDYATSSLGLSDFLVDT
jgi:hypothetical protein